MKSVFNSLAVILGLLALLQIVIALFWLWDFAVFVSGLITGLHAYAWSLVGDLSEKVNRLESKLPYGES